MKTLKYHKSVGGYWALVKVNGRWRWSGNSAKALILLNKWANDNGYVLRQVARPRGCPNTISQMREKYPEAPWMKGVVK